jgi:AsmA protein
MRILKIVGIAVGALVGLVLIAIVLVAVFFDPNDYRGKIEQLAQEQTGRKLTISGDLKLSVFPWVALQTGALSLGEAPGFGDEPFVSIQEARVGARFWPLLRGEFEVGTLRLVGARIRLITDAQGRDNWADLGKQGEASTPEEPSQGPTKIPTIAGLQVQDAAITIQNLQTNSRQVVREFNLESGSLQSGKPFNLKTSFIFDQDAAMSIKVDVGTAVTADFERNVHTLAAPKIDLTISGQGYPAGGVPVEIRAKSLQADVGNEVHALNGLTLATTWKGAGFPAAGVPVSLKADDLNINLATQALQLTGVLAEVAGAKLSGSFTGTEIIDAPKINGPLRLEPVVLRDWLPKLGVTLPKARDPAVFAKLSFASKVAVTKTSAQLDDVTLQLDDTTAKGMLGVADFAAKALRFDLSIDKLDADRYLPPPVEGEGGKAKAAESSEPEPATPIPVEALRTLNARGQLKVNEAVFSGIQFTKLRLGINARDGKVRLNPSEASMYGGQYRGDIGIDATGPLARVTLDEHISSIDFAPLFRDFFETKRVSGKGTANIKLSGVGKTTDDIVNTLDGAIDFNVANGALEGTDLWWEIRRARAVIKQQPLPAAPTTPRTPFSAMKGTATVKNGVLANNDLDIAMQYLKVTGQGNVDLPKSTLDYRLMAIVMKFPQESAAAQTPAQSGATPAPNPIPAPTQAGATPQAPEQDLVDAQIPVKITGKLSDPKVRPDLEGYLKGEVKKKIEQERGKVEQKVKEKLGDKLRDLLKR